jgi:hypothetical protein
MKTCYVLSAYNKYGGENEPIRVFSSKRQLRLALKEYFISRGHKDTPQLTTGISKLIKRGGDNTDGLRRYFIHKVSLDKELPLDMWDASNFSLDKSISKIDDDDSNRK